MNEVRHGGILAAETESADEEFAKLRHGFHERLRSELALLETLAEALGCSTSATASYADIREFAHRLRGAALVFEFSEVGEGAKALELAAIDAEVRGKHPNKDLVVQSTLLALAVRLAQVTGRCTKISA